MTRIPLALSALLLSAAMPALAAAQEGPSFNCDYASTRTEFAICASPDLARLERQMVASYQGLVRVAGERDARALADELLAERQACEGDAQCIADQLVLSMQVFDARSGRVVEAAPAPVAPPVVAAPSLPVAAEPTLPVGTDVGISPFDQAELQALIEEARIARGEAVAAAPLPAPVEPPPVVAAAPAPTPVPTPAPEPAPVVAQANPDIPLAAQAPLPEDIAAAVNAPEPAPDLSDALDDAQLASSDNVAAPTPPAPIAPIATPTPASADPQAAFDTPLSWAFMDLDREERSGVQERLVQAGFFAGATEGAWTVGTLAALEDLAEAEGSGSFDLETQSGASLLLDYIGSDAFLTAFGASEQAAATPSQPVDAGDPLAGTDW